MRVLPPSGFIGGHVVESAENPVVLDWRAPGYILGNIGREEILEGGKFVKGDIRKREDLDRCLDFGELDAVIHLAGISGVESCEEESDLARDVNIRGTEEVLEFARRNDIRNVVFASSAAVYGEVLEIPITEEHPVRPLNEYARNKAEGEKLCLKYFEEQGIGTVILRISNAYGPRSQAKEELTVVPKFVLKAALGEPLTVYGDGGQTRDFVHVKDVVRCFELALESAEASGEAINVGSGEATSINELAGIVAEASKGLYGRDIALKHIEPPEWRREAREKFEYSIEKARDLLGYAPERSLREGIAQMLLEI